MGISSNQARLMTLTARQHDLELRAQQISAGKMITSLQSQQHATEYSTALNNYSKLKQAVEAAKNTSQRYKVNTDDGTFISVNDDYPSASNVVPGALLPGVIQSILNLGTVDPDALLNTAKANYDAAVASLSAQEKLLDMELTQINTEHSAVKTEYDSIKGLVSENTDKSFNVFG